MATQTQTVIINRAITNSAVTLISGCLSLLLIYRFYFVTKKPDTLHILNIVGITFEISVCIAFSFSTLAILTDIRAILVVWYIFFNVAIFSINTLTIMRLYHTFKGSLYEIHKSLTYCYVAYMIILMSSWLSGGYLSYIESFRFARIAISTGAIVFMIGYAHITYKFNHNLFQLVLQQRSTIIHNDQETELNIRQKKLIQAIVKQTLLACWMCLILIFFAISLTCIAIINPPYEGIVAMYGQWVNGLTAIGISITSSLTFAVNGRLYRRICSVCHSKCDKICQSRASKYISNNCNSMNYQLML